MKKGFTFIELLVLVTIIVILSCILVPRRSSSVNVKEYTVELYDGGSVVKTWKTNRVTGYTGAGWEFKDNDNGKEMIVSGNVVITPDN